MPAIEDHAAVAALVLAEHTELPVSSVAINPPAGRPKPDPIAIQVPTVHDVACWAITGDTMVTAHTDAGFVDVSATFRRNGIQVRVWDHLTHRDAHQLLDTLGLEFDDDDSAVIDPHRLLDEVVSA